MNIRVAAVIALTGLATLAAATFVSASTGESDFPANSSRGGAEDAYGSGEQLITGPIGCSEGSLAGDCSPRFCSNCIQTYTPVPSATPVPPPTATMIPAAASTPLLEPTLLPASTPTPTSTNTPTSIPTSTPTALPAGPAGDVNCDGIVNSEDAALILQREAESVASLPCEENGDLDGDGEVTSADAQLVLLIEAKL